MPCPRCDGSAVKVLFQSTDQLLRRTSALYSAVECVQCGLIRLDPCPSPEDLRSWRPEADWWEGIPAFQGRLIRVLRWIDLRRQIRFVERSIRQPAPVLDIGDGTLGSILRKRGIRIVSEEFDRSVGTVAGGGRSPARARQRLPDECISQGPYSAILAFHVIEHARSARAALRELRNLLVPGGSIVLLVPNASCWQALLLAGRWNGCDVPRHPVIYRQEDVEALLEDCGYKILRRKGFSVSEDPAGLATSLCPWLDPAVRHLRGSTEPALTRALKDLSYAVLVALALPLTLLESASGAHASLLIEAAVPQQDAPLTKVLDTDRSSAPGQHSTNRAGK